MSALVARTASFGRKKKSTTAAAAAAPARAAGSADAPPPPSAPGRAARVANALEARSMLLPGVSAAGLPTQNDDMWDGLQAGTDAEFEEATNAYVEVCNNAQVTNRQPSLAARPGEHDHPCACIHARARVHTHTRTPPATHPRARHVPRAAQPSAQPSRPRERRERRLPRPHAPNACGSFGSPRLAVRQAVHAYVAEVLDGKPARPLAALPPSPAPAPPRALLPPANPCSLAFGSRPSRRL